MANKRIKELRGLSATELTTKVRELQASLFQSKMQKATGQLEKTATLWQMRKDLARVKTLLTQKTAGEKTAAAAK